MLTAWCVGSVLVSDTNCMTKGVWGAVCSSSGVPDCSTMPRLKTTTWSAMSNASSCKKKGSQLPVSSTADCPLQQNGNATCLTNPRLQEPRGHAVVPGNRRPADMCRLAQRFTMATPPGADPCIAELSCVLSMLVNRTQVRHTPGRA